MGRGNESTDGIRLCINQPQRSPASHGNKNRVVSLLLGGRMPFGVVKQLGRPGSDPSPDRP